MTYIKTSWSQNIAPGESQVVEYDLGDPFTPHLVEWECWYDSEDVPPRSRTSVWLFSESYDDCTSYDHPSQVPAWVPRPPEGWNESIAHVAGRGVAS